MAFCSKQNWDRCLTAKKTKNKSILISIIFTLKLVFLLLLFLLNMTKKIGNDVKQFGSFKDLPMG